MIASTHPLVKSLRLNPSKRLIRLIALGHLLGVIAVFSSHLPYLWQLLLSMALSGHYISTLYCWWRRPALTLYCDRGAWFLSAAGSKQPQYTVLGCSYWHPWLVILQIEDRSRNRLHWPLLVDSCTRSEFKRLQLIAATCLHKKYHCKENDI